MGLSIEQEIEWRYETKFVLTQEDELRFLDWIANTPDFFKAHATRQVNSVYLDSLDYDCASANLSGLGWRSKFRFHGMATKPNQSLRTLKLSSKGAGWGPSKHAP